MMASLDVARPAAQEQLRVLGEQTGVATLPIVAGQQPVDIARRALQAAKLQGFDVVMLDMAGRLHVDAQLMDEMKAVARVAEPDETLLVVDALTGQDAVNVARSFSDQVELSGVVLTRMGGDARGGAASLAGGAGEGWRVEGCDGWRGDMAGARPVDAQRSDEVKGVARVAVPDGRLFVVGALPGQDAVNVARSFSDQVELAGVVLTRMDGDARGGAALSMRAVTGRPIKFVGVGEKLDALDTFDPRRVAGRIPGMGDVVTLVDKAAPTRDKAAPERLAAKTTGRE